MNARVSEEDFQNQPNLHIFCNNGQNQRHSITQWIKLNVLEPNPRLKQI